MSAPREADWLRDLVRELVALPRETEWVEFKVHQGRPDEIGEYISALSNSAVLASRPRAWMVWGVEDVEHRIVGTQFDPWAAKAGNEPLEAWLRRLLSPAVAFEFHEVEVRGHRVVVLAVPAAEQEPVMFRGREFIRVGDSKRPLQAYREKRRALWAVLTRDPWEQGIAAARVPARDVLRVLNWDTYFDLQKQAPPERPKTILKALETDELIRRCDAGRYDITNPAAILLARDLRRFGSLQFKAVRVIHYPGRSRLVANGEREPMAGYAVGFETICDYVEARLPGREVDRGVFLRSLPDFPMPAVRELIANAMIHQEFHDSGPPRVEIFEGRIEVTNPGEPLVALNRMLDSPPATRNKKVASLMRRFDLCEGRGRGIDRVVGELERHHLPPPRFEIPPGFTRILLFGPRPFARMEREERLRAIYLHASLRYVSGGTTTNQTVRERFGAPESQRAAVSRGLREAVEAGLIRVRNPEAGFKARDYVPFWV